MTRQLIIAGVALSTLLLAWKAPQRKRKKEPVSKTAEVDYKQTGAPMPGIRLYTSEGKYLTDADLPENENVILMLFNPTCEHCEDQARNFKDSLKTLQDTRLFLVAGPMMKDYLEFFIKNTKLKDVKEMPVAVDSSGIIDKTFKYETLPQLNIYNRERKLVKMFYGVTPMDSLRRYLR